MRRQYLKEVSPSMFRQQGVTLIVALVMLLIMTSLGVTTLSGSTLQERMASNSREQHIARVNAEKALRNAEDILEGVVAANPLENNLGNYIATNSGWYAPIQVGPQAASTVGFDVMDEDAWTAVNTNSAVLDGANAVNGVNNARYIVEFLGMRKHRYTFRVTVVAWGGRDSAVSVLQSYYIPD